MVSMQTSEKVLDGRNPHSCSIRSGRFSSTLSSCNVCVVGDPSTRMMRASWSCACLPAKRGRCRNISAIVQPDDQMSVIYNDWDR